MGHAKIAEFNCAYLANDPDVRGIKIAALGALRIRRELAGLRSLVLYGDRNLTDLQIPRPRWCRAVLCCI